MVATHKKYWMPEDEVYLPLHVGAEGKADLGYTKDNTGDNISVKNPNYCELTGMYWAWKNLNCEYIGLCHYRRYFANVPASNNLSDKQKAVFSAVYDVSFARGEWNEENIQKDAESALRPGHDAAAVRPYRRR